MEERTGDAGNIETMSVQGWSQESQSPLGVKSDDRSEGQEEELLCMHH